MRSLNRRSLLAGLAAPALVGLSGPSLAAGRTLKISHSFPSSSGDKGDFRDRLCRRFAAEVEKRTNGELKFDVYPNSSLMKTLSQFSALRKGALDFSLFPTIYAGGEVPELNLTFMPAIVTSYRQAYAWKTAPIGAALTALLESKKVKIVTWMWQSGGIASRTRPLIRPADAGGLKVRGGSREMDMMFNAAGAATLSMPSNEIYAAMQTGAIDCATTSSTSLISFHLEELSRNLTSAGGRSFFFVFEPLLMSQDIFDSLSPDQQKVILAVGEDLEAFGVKGSQEDDRDLADVYGRAKVDVHEMDAATLEEWREVARRSAWTDYAARSPNTARFLKLAQEV